MADLADVEEALVDTIVSAIYPNGLGTPAIVQAPVRVYRGKPTNATLIADRSTGTINISVVTLPAATRNTTRWGVQVTELLGTSSLKVGVSNNSATFFGAAAPGDLAGVLVEQNAFIYEARAGDSAALVAAALADAIRALTICWLTDATITVPGVSSIVARIASSVTSIEEWARQEQGFEVSIWAASPTLRDCVARILTGSFSQINFLTLADGTGGRVQYRSTANVDNEQAASMYRRDLVYDIEYGTTITSDNPTLLFGDIELNGVTIFA